jgi:hypothetical protein
VALAAGLSSPVVAQSQGALQIPYDRGQNVVPVYEGWLRNPDGTFTMMFGYYNRNRKEELDIPLGPDNSFEPGVADRGQPTHFGARRQMFVFSVQLPKDWGQQDLVWTLRARGQTEKAYGALTPVWELDRELIVKNKGTAAFRLDLIKEDQPPSFTVDPVPAIALPGKATLTASVSDDGLPPPRRSGRGGRSAAADAAPQGEESFGQRQPSGLTIAWTHYRGPGRVTFEPAGAALPVRDGKATVVASFSGPGTYVLRAVVSDGLLDVDRQVTVTVAAPGR